MDNSPKVGPSVESGTGPKWVLSRFRLQEVALALEIDPAVDLSVLAPRLGSYDQAHLTRAFVEMLGETPGAYAARSAAARANPVPTSPAPTSPVRTSTAGSS